MYTYLNIFVENELLKSLLEAGGWRLTRQTQSLVPSHKPTSSISTPSLPHPQGTVANYYNKVVGDTARIAHKYLAKDLRLGLKPGQLNPWFSTVQ